MNKNRETRNYDTSDKDATKHCDAMMRFKPFRFLDYAIDHTSIIAKVRK